VAGSVVLIFHRPARPEDAPLVRLLADVRFRLAEQQAAMFRRLGAGEVRIERGEAASFGELLAASRPKQGGLIVMGAGAVPRLVARDARRLVEVARSGRPEALTNNRYSSDVCAIGDATVLAGLPPLPSDNALPRWLEERAGVAVTELPARDRLGLDIDSPLDVGLWALAPGSPPWVRDLAHAERLLIPRADELRELSCDPRRELLVFGRAGSATLRWLERNVRCRVRFLAEERGLRASSPQAIGDDSQPTALRPPRATLGRLLEERGPELLASLVGELADGAIIDTRVLMADRFGADEHAWPPPADRYASDLLRSSDIEDDWLRSLTASAASGPIPIALGAHSLVGPGIPLLLHAAKEIEETPQ
jgi:CTP:molybdopterin cytidylyltransferase MocA